MLVGATVVLGDGQRDCTFWEVTDEAPAWATPLEVSPDVSGNPVVYTRVDVLTEVGVDGRLKTKAEVETIERWLTQQTALYLTARDGTRTSGWRIKPAPQPKIQRKEGDSPDWLVAIRLWRLP